MSIKLLMPSYHLILCCPLLLLLSIFPSIRVFSNEGEGQSRAFRVRTRASGRIWGLPGQPYGWTGAGAGAGSLSGAPPHPWGAQSRLPNNSRLCEEPDALTQGLREGGQHQGKTMWAGARADARQGAPCHPGQGGPRRPSCLSHSPRPLLPSSSRQTQEHSQ